MSRILHDFFFFFYFPVHEGKHWIAPVSAVRGPSLLRGNSLPDYARVLQGSDRQP